MIDRADLQIRGVFTGFDVDNGDNGSATLLLRLELEHPAIIVTGITNRGVDAPCRAIPLTPEMRETFITLFDTVREVSTDRP